MRDTLADKKGWTPLHFAASNGHVKVCEILLGAKADPNAKTKKGETCHDVAVVSHRLDDNVREEVTALLRRN